MKRMLMLSLSVIAGLSLFIAQITTVGACPPFAIYQPEVPASLKK
jgi:cyclic lactone autoinducer peptide